MRLKIVTLLWKREWISFFITVCCIGYLLNFTWLKWGDILVDVGREMYVPMELASGKLLYRDIIYVYGPFSPYFNASLFKLFGTHINSLVFSGLITISLASFFLYKISRGFLNIFFSIFCVLTFLFVFAFGHHTYFGNYNFVVPYTYAATHGITLALAAVYCFFLWWNKRERRYIYSCSLCIFLTLLCRLEIGTALLLSYLIGGILLIIFLRDENKIYKTYFTFLLVIPIVFTVLVFSAFYLNSKAIVQSGVFAANLSYKEPFTARLFGSDDLLANIFIMLKTFLYYILYCVLFTAGAYLIEKRRAFTFLISLVFIFITFMSFGKFFKYSLQYRALPILTLIALFISVRDLVRKKDKKELFFIVLAVFSFFVLVRMLFHAWAGHYGFYILVPSLLIYYIFFLKMIPERLNLLISKRFFTLSFIFLFTLFIISHFNVSKLCYDARTLRVDTNRGNLCVFNNDREQRYGELIEFLRNDTGKEETVMVIPQGIAINFLSERKNPFRYYSYLPIDIAQKDIADKIISDMEQKEVDYVVFTQKSTAEFGYPVFGRDYGRVIFEYITKNYILYKQFGPFPFTTKEYGIALFKRKI